MDALKGKFYAAIDSLAAKVLPEKVRIKYFFLVKLIMAKLTTEMTRLREPNFVILNDNYL